MTIREIAQEDYSSLLDVASSAVLETVEAPAPEKAGLLDGIRNNLDLVCTSAIAGVFLAAIESGEPSGFILVKDYWNLSDLFVLPKFQSKGIGRDLWDAAHPICTAKSKRPTMRVNSSLNAIKFYESLGFKRTIVEQQLQPWIIPMARELKVTV